MKQIIQKLLKQYGYSISKIVDQNPFIDMRRLLREREDELIIFDVGAHHGQTSQIFRNLFPNSVIYAFEPFLDSFIQLKKNTESDSKICAFNFGLSNVQGLLPFYSNSSSQTNSLLAPDESGGIIWGTGLLETKEIVQAKFKTLDSVVEEMEIPRIDILKMDCQGAESLVILGATKTLNKDMISIVYSEMIAQPTYKNQKRFDELLAIFYDAKFDLYDLYNISHASDGRLIQVDALFAKSNILQNRSIQT